MRDCLLLVDLFNDFAHEDGDALFACFEERFPRLLELIRTCRAERLPITYANDSYGLFDGERGSIIDRARGGPAGHLVDGISPIGEERFIVKPRYSAFDYTPLALILEELGIERIILAGMSTEGCVAQTAISAREEGFKVSVVAPACCTVDLELEKIALAYLEHVVGARITA
jgi:nicotinamidase-related amidase